MKGKFMWKAEEKGDRIFFIFFFKGILKEWWSLLKGKFMWKAEEKGDRIFIFF